MYPEDCRTTPHLGRDLTYGNQNRTNSDLSQHATVRALWAYIDGVPGSELTKMLSLKIMVTSGWSIFITERHKNYNNINTTNRNRLGKTDDESTADS